MCLRYEVISCQLVEFLSDSINLHISTVIILTYFKPFYIFTPMKREQGYDHLIKLLIIGNSGVGKTNLLIRFTENNFLTSHLTTIGTHHGIQASISKQKYSIWATAESNCKFGIQPVNSALRQLHRHTTRGPWESSSHMRLTIELPSMILKTGSNKSKCTRVTRLSRCW